MNASHIDVHISPQQMNETRVSFSTSNNVPISQAQYDQLLTLLQQSSLNASNQVSTTNQITTIHSLVEYS